MGTVFSTEYINQQEYPNKKQSETPDSCPKLTVTRKTFKIGNYPIYDNQIEAANEIIDHYLQNHRACILHAEMQAGKTGVAVYSALQAKHQLGLDQIIFICGMADNSVKKQAEDRFAGIPQVLIWFNPDLQKAIKEKKSFVNKKILVIVDESHYGSQRNQKVHDFLITVTGIDPARDASHWINKNAYYLSISATPFTEQAANLLFKPSKSIVHLIPSMQYKGLKYLLTNGYIRESFKLLTDDDFEKLCEQLQFDQNAYYIIRMNGLSYVESCMNYLIKSKNFTEENFINMHCSFELTEMNINKYLDIKPEKPTIIFVHRSLSASYTPHLQFVAAMFEAPGKHIETTIQRFPGRACGNTHYQPPIVYTSMTQVEQYISYIESEQRTPNQSKEGAVRPFPLSCKYLHKTNKVACGQPNQPFIINLIDLVDLMVEFARKKQLSNYLSSQIDLLRCRVGGNKNHLKILSDQFVDMGASSYIIKKNGQAAKTIQTWWENGLKAWQKPMPWYTSHTVKNGNIPINQRYFYFNGMYGTPYYGYLLVTSIEHCEKRQIDIDISVESMFHINNAFYRRQIVKKIDQTLSQQFNQQKKPIFLKTKVETQNGQIKSIQFTIQPNNFCKTSQNETMGDTPKKTLKEKTLKEKIPKKFPLKEKIPKKVRLDTWNQYIGPEKGLAKCLICNVTEIDKGSDYHCGHVISDRNGGLPIVENLRPICPACNYSMGTMNLIEWTQKYYPNAPVLLTF